MRFVCCKVLRCASFVFCVGVCGVLICHGRCCFLVVCVLVLLCVLLACLGLQYCMFFVFNLFLQEKCVVVCCFVFFVLMCGVVLFVLTVVVFAVVVFSALLGCSWACGLHLLVLCLCVVV